MVHVGSEDNDAPKGDNVTENPVSWRTSRILTIHIISYNKTSIIPDASGSMLLCKERKEKRLEIATQLLWLVFMTAGGH